MDKINLKYKLLENGMFDNEYHVVLTDYKK